MEVNQVPARRQGRVLEQLNVLPHVVEDGIDEIASRPAGGLTFHVLYIHTPPG
jgi:hypothetical protein